MGLKSWLVKKFTAWLVQERARPEMPQKHDESGRNRRAKKNSEKFFECDLVHITEARKPVVFNHRGNGGSHAEHQF